MLSHSSVSRWVAIVLFVVLGAATNLRAQSSQPGELAISVSALLADPGEAEVAGVPIELENETLIGLEVRGTYRPHPRLGLDVSFSVHNGGIRIPGDVVTIQSEGAISPIDLDIDFKQVALLGGPRVSLASNPEVDFSVRALVGMSNGVTSASATELFGVTVDDTVFAAVVGASLTVYLNDRLGLLIGQPEVFITRFGGATQANFRMSAGVVFR